MSLRLNGTSSLIPSKRSMAENFTKQIEHGLNWPKLHVPISLDLVGGLHWSRGFWSNPFWSLCNPSTTFHEFLRCWLSQRPAEMRNANHEVVDNKSGILMASVADRPSCRIPPPPSLQPSPPKAKNTRVWAFSSAADCILPPNTDDVIGQWNWVCQSWSCGGYIDILRFQLWIVFHVKQQEWPSLQIQYLEDCSSDLVNFFLLNKVAWNGNLFVLGVVATQKRPSNPSANYHQRLN